MPTTETAWRLGRNDEISGLILRLSDLTTGPTNHWTVIRLPATVEGA